MATRILIVAYRTAATPLLIEHVRRRAAREACSFTLLVPGPYWDPDTDQASITLELALPLLEDAAGSPVNGVIGASDPYIAARDELERGQYNDAMISTLPGADLTLAAPRPAAARRAAGHTGHGRHGRRRTQRRHRPRRLT